VSDLALAWRQYRLERRMFWRNPSSAFFNFVLPLLFLALFGAIFSGNQKQLNVIVPGIAGMATNACLQMAIVLLAGRLFFGIPWPQDWLELVVYVAAGVVCLAALGVAWSHVVPNFDSAAAYQNIVFLPVIFISGVFYDVKDAPSALHDVAQALPLTHIIDGLSGAIVTGRGLGDNASGLVMIGVWALIGIFFAVRGFRWETRRTG
jgi:ABC-2 type transport system permease protein